MKASETLVTQTSTHPLQSLQDYDQIQDTGCTTVYFVLVH